METVQEPQVSLEEIQVNQLPELQGWKEKQQAIVKENPFVAVEDNKSYETAKKHRTTLVSARTSIEKQEKLIASKIKDFRTKVANTSKELIAITQPHEEKQQDEVRRYEAEKEAERLEKEKIERERKEAIQKEINDLYETWKIEIRNLEHLDIDNIKEVMESRVAAQGEKDMEEFEMDFSEKANLLRTQLQERIQYLAEKEEARKEAERLAAERAAFQKEQAEARAKAEKEESERKAREEKERAKREASENKIREQRESEAKELALQRKELEAEKQRLADEEAERQAKIEAERKAKEEAAAKIEAERKEKARKATEEKRLKALQPDKEKIRDFIFSLRFETEAPKVKDANSKKFLDEIQNDVEAWKTRVLEEVNTIK